MDGILIIDKPEGLTSHDVVVRVRRILQTRRVGHTGTLDPFATGVMVVLVGKATRLAQFLDKDEKEYEATLRFGFETDTGDRTGIPKTKWTGQPSEIGEILSAVDWDEVLGPFRGETRQTPPMFSAKKIDGKKLYEHAREGVEVERKAVKVNISKIEMTNNHIAPDKWTVNLRIVCSAGTYIRQLAVDLGRRIGVGAHLTELRRTRAGRFDLSQAITLEDLEGRDEPAAALLPTCVAVEHLSQISLAADRVEKTKSGLSTRILDTELASGQPLRMLDESNNLIAVGFYDESERSVQPKVVLV